jgi:hypothetical protein
MARRKLLPLRVLAVFAVALFTGVIVISIGVGTEATPINTVMSPLVCPGDDIVPAWTYRGHRVTVHGPELRTRWICVNKQTGEAHIAGYRTIFTAGLVYALILTVLGVALLRSKAPSLLFRE